MPIDMTEFETQFNIPENGIDINMFGWLVDEERFYFVVRLAKRYEIENWIKLGRFLKMMGFPERAKYCLAVKRYLDWE